MGLPPLEEAVKELYLEEIDTYITRRQNMATQYVAKQLIFRLFLEEEQRPGLWVPKRWW